jgi:hypothetical protein
VVGRAALRELRREAVDEAAHLPARDLHARRLAGVVGVFDRDEGGAVKVVDRVGAAAVLVRHPGLQPVDVVAAAFQGQVAEHVVERAVLEHQDHDVLDLGEGCRGVGRAQGFTPFGSTVACAATTSR